MSRCGNMVNQLHTFNQTVVMEAQQFESDTKAISQTLFVCFFELCEEGILNRIFHRVVSKNEGDVVEFSFNDSCGKSIVHGTRWHSFLLVTNQH